MRKKPYLAPQMKVQEMEPMSIICQSFGVGSQNETYEIVSEEDLKDWF